MIALWHKILLLLRVMRPYQWTKNTVVLAAIFFSMELTNPELLPLAIFAFLAFCCASSATYIFNDIMDIEKDRNHPTKCYRPLASGKLTIQHAWKLSIVLFCMALISGLMTGPAFLIALGIYLGLTFSYSVFLKRIPILDVIVLSLGFVIRALAGALAINVEFTNWLVICTFFLALFLALSKRRHEVVLLEKGAGDHRPVLEHYSLHYLDQMILLVAGGALLTYTIYTCSIEVIERFDTDKLYVTVPFVVFGLFRYLYLNHQKQSGGDPSRALINDFPLGMTVVLWALTCGIIIYII